jgi:hypothetical protein
MLNVELEKPALVLESVPVPSVIAPSLNVTIPVGVPPPLLVTVAVNVTACPNVLGLAEEESPVAVAPTIYVNLSAALVGLVPPGVVTVTSTVPLPAGEIAVIDVELLAVNDTAPVFPNLTAVAPVKFTPVIATPVPPVGGPLFGEIEVTVGIVPV